MARQELINSDEDMKWLRDVHIHNLPPKYKSAVITGNMDYPQRIDVYIERDPEIDDKFVTYIPDDDGDYIRIDVTD